MSSTLVTAGPLSPRNEIPILTPRNDPYLIYQSFLNYIPSASLVQPNTLSNSDALSVLCYTLVTTPDVAHAWAAFKFFQEDALKANAGMDVSTPSNSFSFAFPPSPFLADISKAVVNFWNVLEPDEVVDWAELARDIRNAHTQLVASFGNGINFYGKDWEEQRHYHARSLYFKWMGLQAIHGVTGTNVSASTYMPQYWAQTETDPQSYGETSNGGVDPYLTTFNEQYT